MCITEIFFSCTCFTSYNNFCHWFTFHKCVLHYPHCLLWFPLFLLLPDKREPLQTASWCPHKTITIFELEMLRIFWCNLPSLNPFLEKDFAFKKKFPAWTSSEATCNRQYMWCLGSQRRTEKEGFTFSVPWHVQNVHVAQADIRHLKQKTC